MTNNIELTYKKNDNKKLFSNFENKSLLDVSKVQNYIPLYNRFFDINSSNYSNINLNNRYSIKSIDKKLSYNKYEGILEDSISSSSSLPDTKRANIFFKYSPLLDPVKYLNGKYTDLTNLLNLPTFSVNNNNAKNNIHPKLNDNNNSAYVDSFFTYLTSKLLQHHDFIHGIDFYGSFLGIKHNYMCDIQDDIDYLSDSSFFKSNNEILYTIDINDDHHIESIYKNNTRDYKKNKPLKINDIDNVDDDFDESIIKLTDIKDITQLGLNENSDCITELLFDKSVDNIKKPSSLSSCSSSSSCSSRSSITEDEGEEDEEDDDNINDEDIKDHDDDDHEDKKSGGEDDDDDDDDSEEDDAVYVKIKDFPVQIIGLECCENTLDSLITDNDLNDDEWDSIVLQILMMLITFQKTFSLTHNDLHTNNIMYNKTDKDYLYYKIDDKYYKVPTYGRIFKIIDFGRAIYKFKNELICSDSFHEKEGDAATQYNCQPYYNTKKPLIEPNFSFDLCRIGCSIFDFIVAEDEDDLSIEKIKSPILRIIAGWCKDDKGRNILYKKNGDERYPDFKLYKMIARKVHNHVPLNVLRNTYFDKYLMLNKKVIKTKVKENKIIDIDNIPTYFSTF